MKIYLPLIIIYLFTFQVRAGLLSNLLSFQFKKDEVCGFSAYPALNANRHRPLPKEVLLTKVWQTGDNEIFHFKRIEGTNGETNFVREARDQDGHLMSERPPLVFTNEELKEEGGASLKRFYNTDVARVQLNDEESEVTFRAMDSIGGRGITWREETYKLENGVLLDPENDKTITGIEIDPKFNYWGLLDKTDIILHYD